MFEIKPDRYSEYLPNCTYKVGDTFVVRPHIRVRTMNFSQNWRSLNVTEANYILRIPLGYVVDFVNINIEEYIEDAKVDPDYTLDLDNELRKHEWPKINDVFSDHEYYKTLIFHLVDFYGHQILLYWFGDGKPEKKPGYILNTIESFRMISGFYEFKGIAGVIE